MIVSLLCFVQVLRSSFCLHIVSRFCELAGICFQSVSEHLVELLSVSHLMTADVTGDVTAQLFEGDLEVSQRFPGFCRESS